MTRTHFLDWRKEASIENLVDYVLLGASQYPERLFAKHGSMELTFADLLRTMRGFASEHGAAVNAQTVAISMPNSIFSLTTYLSVLYAGGVPALLNNRLPEKAAQALFGAISPALVLTQAPLDWASDWTNLVIDEAAISRWHAADQDAPNNCQSGEAAATYLCTGGTTGIPKRVCYSHNQLLAAGERMQWGWPMSAGEVFLPIAPFSHIYGFLMGICVPLQTGGSTILMDAFHPKDVLDLLEANKVSVIGGGPPAIYQALLAQDDLELRDLSALRVCPGGGAPFPVAVLDEWKSRTGLDIYEGYGMTEVAPIAVNTAELGAKAGAAGKAVPDLKVRILSLDGEDRILPNGEAGEICVSAPHLMAGYVEAEEETAEVLKDGWMKTGDVGVLDEDGFIVITDRKKDVILHKGFNVFPREVEEALLAHPDIVAACVVGAPDERSGERVVAYIKLREGAQLGDDAIVSHCKEYLVSYRLPGQIERLEDMPLTPAGKMDRMALRDLARESLPTKLAV